jgi:imidazolonepropionase-like amidohydrolase
MKSMDAILSGTKTAARALGWERRIGTLEAGKLGDILIVKGNPLMEIGI